MLPISRLSIVNQCLGQLGRLPVTNILDSADAQLLDTKIDILLPVYLERTRWNFAIKYYTSSTPLTTQFSPDYQNTFQLPADYGQMFNWGYFDDNFSDQAAYPFLIADGTVSTNMDTIIFYYLVNTVDVSIITPMFYRALVLYISYDTCLVLTQNEGLAKEIYMKFEQESAYAVIKNDMERFISTIPYNDYVRTNFV